jgi:hypothetical protein
LSPICRIATVALLLLAPRDAPAQACCAGTSALTPGRLAAYEDWLVGLRVRAANAFGSWSSEGAYASAPTETSEWDFEQDLVGAIRLTRRAQIAALIPVVETYRRSPSIRDIGGGIGDVNLSGRYDFVLLDELHWLPGIAALVGVTFPTGTPPESAHRPLATDATGTGAFQGHAGIAIEKSLGPWLFAGSALLDRPTPRSVDGVTVSKGAEWTILASAAYAFPSDDSVAFQLSNAYAGESRYAGQAMSGSSQRSFTVTVAGAHPLGAQWRLQLAAFVNPPLSDLGRGALVSAGLAVTLVKSGDRPPACPPPERPTEALGRSAVLPF